MMERDRLQLPSLYEPPAQTRIHNLSDYCNW
jgi:hypothetical protein